MNLNKAELEKFEHELEELRYNRYDPHYKSEDFGYWKSFDVTRDEDGDKVVGYQLALLFYDFSKYPNNTHERPIGVQFEFLLGPQNSVGRIDLSVSGDKMTIEEFERIAQKFYTEICSEFLLKNQP